MRLTADQELMRDALRKFVTKELPPGFARACDEQRRAPIEVYRKLADLGYLGVGVPEQYGGSGGGIVDLAILLHELAKGMFSFSIMVYRSAVHGAQSLLTYGTEEQRRFFLPKIVAGQVLTCLSLTEPEAGSDAANVKIRAVREGDEYVITGEKLYNSSAHIADYILLVARTSTHEERHRGITLFLIDTKSPNLTINHLETLGERAVGTNRVFYDDVRVPVSRVVGKIDQGWYHLMTNLEKERLSVAAYCTGAAQSALAAAVEHAKQRVQFNKPLAAFQVIQHKLADMAMDTHIAELLTYDLAQRIQDGIECRRAASITKAYCSEMYNRVAYTAMQIHGGSGYEMSSDMQLHYRDARLMTIGAGSSEILRNVIAKDVLGEFKSRRPVA